MFSYATKLKRARRIVAFIALTAAATSVSCNRTDRNGEVTKRMTENQIRSLVVQADQHMREQRAGDALKVYQAAALQGHEYFSKSQQVWLLLSIANAAIRQGDLQEANDTLSNLLAEYRDTGIVLGNPLFHLLVGLSYHGVGENPDAATDNFARALICGGPEIFAGENPIHLERMQKILHPPAETGTWTGYKGCSRDLLNGATGYLRELLAKKIGTPQPYAREELLK